MQATESKPQGNTKCHNTGGKGAATTSKDKKNIAQRVMDVVTEQSPAGAEMAPAAATTTTTTPTVSPNATSNSSSNGGSNNNNNNNNNNNGSKMVNEGTSILKVSAGSDNNSVGSTNDHEVETITNRAAKIELSPASTNGKQNQTVGSGSTNSSSTSSLLPPQSDTPTATAKTATTTTSSSSQQYDQDCPKQQQQQNHHHHHHNHPHQYHKQQQQQHGDSSAKISPNTSNTNGSNNNVSFNLSPQHASSKSDLADVEYMNEQQQQQHTGQLEECKGARKKGAATTATTDTDSSQPIISLETKVPHPLRSNFQFVTNEEVSYYNDTPLVVRGAVDLLEPKQVGGSLDNNTKPRLLAASIREQHSQQQLLIDAPPPKMASSCQQLRHNIGTSSDNNLYINEQQAQSGNNIRASNGGGGYEQYTYAEYDVADEYYLGYDNAFMEIDLAQQYKQQQQQQHHNHHHQEKLAIERDPTITGAAGHRRQKPSVSISTSPKAKSAPATPCNVTPTAFHQHTSHLDSMTGTGANLANTLPPDIRKNISATCRVLPSSIVNFGGPRNATIANAKATTATGPGVGLNSTSSKTMLHGSINLKNLDHLNERAEVALRDKDYPTAIRLFSQCINLATTNQNVAYLKKNFKIYSHRAEAHFNLGNYHDAIDDSRAARELNPKWTKAYYLQGRSQFMIGEHADSLAIFSFGLTQDPTNKTLFEALIEAALNNTVNNFKQEFETKFNTLKALKLDKKPFVVVSILGQELLIKGHSQHAAIVLESALKINNSLESSSSTAAANGSGDNQSSIEGNTNYQMKFKSSVLSTISLAYCMMKDYDKAIANMLKELEIEKELEDVNGQCRVLGNLGFTYYKLRKLDKSLEAHRKQLNLAMKTQLFQEASQALNAIGHVHEARGDYSNALTSHTRCFDILKQLGDNYYSQSKELLSIGYIHSMLNELDSAQEKYNEAFQLIKCKQVGQEEYTTGSIMVNFNMAYLELKRQQFQEARECYDSVIKLAQSIANPVRRGLIEVRALNGMGQTYRLQKRFDEASGWFKRQLQVAESLDYLLGQSQALCNLGMIYQHYKEYQKAWQLFNDNLILVDKYPLLKAYAHSYMASTYYLMKKYNDAKKHYEASLNLFRDLDYCPAELKTIESNMAFIQERMGPHEVMIHPSAANNSHNNINQVTHQKKGNDAVMITS